MTADGIRLPWSTTHAELVAAIVDVQARCRTRLAHGPMLATAVLRQQLRVVAVAETLGVPIRALRPRGSWWQGRAEDGVTTVVHLDHDGITVRRQTPSVTETPGMVRMSLSPVEPAP